MSLHIKEPSLQPPTASDNKKAIVAIGGKSKHYKFDEMKDSFDAIKVCLNI